MNQPTVTPKAKKGYRGVAMEGRIARWYAKNVQGDQDYRLTAQRLAQKLAPGSHILELASGPGYLAIEFARLGRYLVTGVDISRTFVEIAKNNAQKAGVEIDFHLGEAANMPFEDNTFDFVVCRAAFKNFSEPVRALREIQRVLKPGGKGLIIDMRHDATQASIEEEVKKMNLNAINKIMTRWTFRAMLLKTAYTIPQIKSMLAQTDFKQYEVHADNIGFEAWMTK